MASGFKRRHYVFQIHQQNPMAAKIGAAPASKSRGHSTEYAERWGKGTMVIPRPLDVDELIRQVRQGKLVTVLQLREELAKRSQVDVACPLTTGIFVRI